MEVNDAGTFVRLGVNLLKGWEENQLFAYQEQGGELVGLG